jgi:hypothetical protein
LDDMVAPTLAVAKWRRGGAPLQRCLGSSVQLSCPALPSGRLPLMESCVPCSVFVSDRGSGLFGLPRSPTTLVLSQPGPWSIPSTTAPRCPFKRRSHPLLGFHSPTGCYRRLPPRCEPFSRQLVLLSVVPSHGVLLPTAIARTKGPYTPRIPLPGTVRLQSSNLS